MWAIWHRRDGEVWQSVGTFPSEREALTWSNGAKLRGDVLVLPEGSDPRTPCRVVYPGPRHYTGRRIDTSGVAATRGRCVLLRGRVF